MARITIALLSLPPLLLLLAAVVVGVSASVSSSSTTIISLASSVDPDQRLGLPVSQNKDSSNALLTNLLSYPSHTQQHKFTTDDDDTPTFIPTTSACPPQSFNSLVTFISCLQKHFLPANAISKPNTQYTYYTPPPKPTFKSLLQPFLHRPEASTPLNCTDELLLHNSELTKWMTVSLFRDTETTTDYCILHDRFIIHKKFVKSWIVFITPLSRPQTTNNIHLMIPHPLFDTPTLQQATYIFSKDPIISHQYLSSLLISAHHRDAFKSIDIVNTCYKNSPVSDPTHSNSTAFHIAAESLYELVGDDDVFLQFHAKSDSTCTGDDVFMSTGVGVKEWYTKTSDTPFHRVLNALESVFAKNVTIATPASSECVLKATKNLFGKIVNGVPAGVACGPMTAVEFWRGELGRVDGRFVHVEQSRRGRCCCCDGSTRRSGNKRIEKVGWDRWVRALRYAFL